MADSASVRVDGLDEFRRDLGRVSPQLKRTLQVANKAIAKRAVDRVRPAVASLPSPGGNRAAKGITARGTQKHAVVAFSRARSRQPLTATILGAHVHPVFGRPYPVAKMRRRLWQPHLGARWSPEDLYGAGPVLVKIADEFSVDEYLEAFLDALGVAFPGAR